MSYARHPPIYLNLTDMKRFLAVVFLSLTCLAMSAEELSSVECTGSWVYLYNAKGKKYKTLSANSVGTVLGHSSTFIVSRNGNWIYLWDNEGRKYKTMSASSVGDVISVAGETFTSRNGNWIYTWSKDGKKIATRSAR